MKIILTEEESLKCLFDALCDGLHILTNDCNLDLKYNKEEYKSSLSKLKKPYFEEVLIQMLKDGYKLTLDNHSIEIKDVYKRISNAPANHILKVLEERGDAINAEVILQYVFFNEEIYA